MRHHLQSADEGPSVHPAVIPDHGHLARENERLAREVARLRAAVQKDIELFQHWADSLIGVRTRAAQAVRVRMRRDELRKLLDPAAAPTPGVPSVMRAAESRKV